jgi:hypothetical protein
MTSPALIDGAETRMGLHQAAQVVGAVRPVGDIFAIVHEYSKDDAV